MSTAPEPVDAVAKAAHAAAEWTAARPPADRRADLEAVADALEGDREHLVTLADRESHLGPGRLNGELTRTVFQLRFLGRVLCDGLFTAPVVDRAAPDWPVGPRPDLLRVLVPLGPVVVFAAGNFPFAFSVAGGDTASALAAGCPVVLKAHPGHPELSRRVARLVVSALADRGAPGGVFSLLEDDADGREALVHPLVRAGAFTGSPRVGRLLFDLAARRPEPIPFFGELGSVNPVVVTPRAAAARGRQIAEGFVQSMCNGAGQFCTKPGVLAVPSASGIAEAVVELLSDERTHPLLSPRVEEHFDEAFRRLASVGGLALAVEGSVGAEGARPFLLTGTVAGVLEVAGQVMAECFGPAAVVLTYERVEEALLLVSGMEGQLTGTVHGTDEDPDAPALVAAFAEKVGRVLWNGWPTGVSVTWAMHHGGPWPATTAPSATSVGAAAITRFLRPVVFQDVPAGALPPGVRPAAGVPAIVDGTWSARGAGAAPG